MVPPAIFKSYQIEYYFFPQFIAIYLNNSAQFFDFEDNNFLAVSLSRHLSYKDNTLALFFLQISLNYICECDKTCIASQLNHP